MKNSTISQISFSKGGGYTKYYLVLMFTLLISLQGWGQPGGGPEQPCDDNTDIPLSFVGSELPCSNNDPFIGTFYFSIAQGVSGAVFYVTDPSSQANITTSVDGNGTTHVNVTFNSSGWKKLIVTSNKNCYSTANLEIPVLCSCPNEPYDILGSFIEGKTVVVNNAKLAAFNRFYVINNLTITDQAGVSFDNKTFTVLGKNQYNVSNPGGVVNGPYIKLGDLVANNTLVNCGGGALTTFQGDPCFGMWGGLVIKDSIGISPSVNIENCNIKDAYRAVGILPGTLNKVKIWNSTFFGNLYGVISSRNGLIAFHDNTIESAEMLKPFDYVAGGHNESFDVVNNRKNKFYTHTGLWHSGKRSTVMLGTEWSNNTFRTCIKGIHITNNDKAASYWRVQDAIFDKNHFTGITIDNYNTDILSVSRCQFIVENPDSYQSESPLLYYDRTFYHRDESYGVYCANYNNEINIDSSSFQALSQGCVGIYATRDMGRVKANSFAYQFNPSIRAVDYYGIIEENFFKDNVVSILTDGTILPVLNVHCNNFEFLNPTYSAFKFYQSIPSGYSICTSVNPCGNAFLNEGIVVDNDGFNPSLKYFLFSNEKYDKTIHFFKNASDQLTLLVGRNGPTCPSALNIFKHLKSNTISKSVSKHLNN